MTELATYEGSPGNTALMLNPTHLNNMMAVANIMASGRCTVPAHLQKSPGDCLAVVMQAAQWGMNPFAVAQKTHVVSGTLGYEGQLVNAVINTSGLLQHRLKFEWFGNWEKIVGKFKTVESKTKKDDNGYFKKYIVPNWNENDEVGLGVRCWSTLKGEVEPRTLEILMAQARTRNSTLWTEDPKQQIAYLAEKRWARLHAPDVMMGVYTPDELEREPKDMGMADEVLPAAKKDSAELPACSDELFATRLTEWHKAIASGRATAEAVLAKAATKYTLTDEQKAAVRKSPVAEDAKPAAAAPAAVSNVSFAVVADQLNKAADMDALDAAADLIGEVADQAHRSELLAKYDALRAELTA